MSKLLTTIGLGLVLAMTTAAASPSSKPAKQAANPPSNQASAEQRYCLKLERTTGSNVDRSGCRTKVEWRKLGIDLDDLAKNEN